MKKFKRTYHVLAVTALIAVMANILLPASLSAASLFCEMQQSVQGGQHASACWNTNSTVQADGFSQISTCSFQEICDQAVSGDTQHTEAIPQVTKSFAVAFVLTTMLPEYIDSFQHQFLECESIAFLKKLPLFLLNSTFLN